MNSLNILPFLFNLVLSFNCSKEFTCQDYETNFEDIKICIDYDPQTRPQKVLNLNGPNVLYRQYLIQQVKHLDQLKEEITIEGKTTFEYQDLRLTWPSECDENEKFYDATLDTMDTFWIHPMIFASSIGLNDISMKKGFFRKPDRVDLFLKNTGFFHMDFITLENYDCPMDFRWFPFDTQQCDFILESRHLPKLQVTEWLDLSPAEELNQDVQVSGWQVTGPQRWNYTQIKDGMEWFYLKQSLRFVRYTSFEIMQTFIPSLMLTLANAISVWIPSHCMPARMALIVTTFLSLINLFKGSRSEWPTTAYLKAVDYWTIFCYFGAFFCLIEYSIVLSLTNALKDEDYHKFLARKIEQYSKVFISIYVTVFPVLFFLTCQVNYS